MTLILNTLLWKHQILKVQNSYHFGDKLLVLPPQMSYKNRKFSAVASSSSLS